MTNPETQPRIIPLTDIESLRAAGLMYPETVDGWRWLYRFREEHGFTRSFVRAGRRVMVDVEGYVADLRAQRDRENRTA